MARPKKNNAEYFSHDADMRNDMRIKALRRKFSHTGYAVWCYLLETLTDSDFFEVEWEEINIELLAADYDVTVEDLHSIVGYCLKIGLLQMQDDKLLSEAHQARLKAVIDNREQQRANGKLGGNPNFKKGVTNPYYKPEETLPKDNPEITDPYVSDEETLPKDNQSKVKETKVKETKVIYPYQDIVELWNSTCVHFPKIVKITDVRKNKIRVRLEEFGKTQGEQLSIIEKLFKKTQESKFMRGDNKTGWKASFDWIFENPRNWVRVIEGNYDNDKPPASKSEAKPPNGASTRNYDEEF